MTTTETLIEEAQEVLGYEFNQPELLSIALTHASIADSRLASNERLEFLGDAVLGMVVCEYLYDRFPDLLEGELTKIKSAAVSRRMCAKITKELGLDTLLILGKGMKSRSSIPSSLSAAVLEAIIGAIYIDADLETVRSFILPLLKPHIEMAARSGHQQNFKSVLQHYAQRRLPAQPTYALLDEKGPDHAKCFKVAVVIGEREFDACWASSKKQAEQRAALLALDTLGLIHYGENGEVFYIGDRNGGEGQIGPTRLTSEEE